MKKEKIVKIVVFISCILLIVLSFWADKFMFFDAKLDAVNYSYVETPNDKPVQVATSLWFAYGENNEVQYGIDKTIDEKEVKVFSKEYGTGVSSYRNIDFAPIRENTIGYLIASAPLQTIDIDSDGEDENVYDFARTQFGLYAYLGGPSKLFESKEIPFELLFSEGKYMKVYYKNRLITSGTITIVENDGTTNEYKINEEGHIENLSIYNIRNGFTGIYTLDGENYYRMYYILEGYDYFSLHTFEGYKPLFLVIIFTIILIIIVQFFRKMHSRKTWEYKVYSRREKYTGEMIGKSNFEKLRWFLLILSFIAWTFLGRWISQGQLFNQITIPTFTCPFNYDQVVQSSCFYASHLNHLFEEGPSFILVFSLTFFLFAIFIGRMLCAFMCPMGLIQDILDKIRAKLHIKPIIITERINKIIQPIKWVWIILFVSLAFLGGDFCDICPNKIFSPVLNGYRVELFLGGFITVIVLAGSFFIKRFWCLMCPVGYILGIFHKFNLFKLKKDCTACTECGACYEECPMRLKNIYIERKKEVVQETDCLMCGKCIDKCPEDNGLYITFCGKTIYRATRERFALNNKKKIIKKYKKKIKNKS